MNLKNFLLLFLFFIGLTSCSTDFKRVEVKTPSLEGYIEGGNGLGLYGKASLKLTGDSLVMKDWPMSRLVDNLNVIIDSSLTDQTSFNEVYTIKITNKSQLEQREFIDSMLVQLNRLQLVK